MDRNSVDNLLGLEVLAIKAPDVYRSISSNPIAYTGSDPNAWDFGGLSERIAKYEKERDEALSELATENRRHVMELLKSLFPQLGGDGSERDAFYSRNGRIAAVDRLMIALKFGLPMSEVSVNTVRRFVLDSAERSNVLSEDLERESVERFLELLQRAIEDLELADQIHFAWALVELAESKKIGDIDRARTEVFASSVYRQVWFVLRASIEKLDRSARFTCISELVSNYRGVGQGSFVLDHCLRVSGFFGEEGVVAEELRWCDEDQLAEIKSTWLGTVVAHSTREEIFGLNGAGRVFWLLRRLDEAAATSVAQAMLDKNEDVDVFVRAIAESGRDSVKGRYAEVSEAFLDSIGGKDSIRARVQERRDNNPDASAELCACYSSVINGKKYYLADCSECD